MATGNPLSMQVLEALARGDKIGAIKLLREAGAPSLRAALQAIEAQATDAKRAAKQQASTPARDAAAPPPAMKKRQPTVAMGDPPGQLRWLFVVVALIAAAVWIGFGGGA